MAAMDNDIRIGVLPTTGKALLGDPVDARHLLYLAVEAERLGFASVWANDSLVSPRVEALTLLAAIASVTHRITIGTAALIPAYRQPVQAAQAIASLDVLSRGRVVLGVGAGFPGLSDPDFALVGVPTRGRSARLDDIVALWKQLWTTSGSSSFHGKVLHFDSLPDPLPPHRPGGPPVWLAAGNSAAPGRAGRHYDGWLPYPPTPDAYENGLNSVREAALAAGRDPGAVTPALFVTIGITEDLETGHRLLEDYTLATYHRPLEYVKRIQVLIAGPPDHVSVELGRFLVAGARHIVVRLAALEPTSQLDQIHRVAEALLPNPISARVGTC
jgi:alkanesulfonate monooxygenase SsuD/methylene tetrahydromethanopterin reductase-like flavin-dependent oxidoreductase (luciferase family)